MLVSTGSGSRSSCVSNKKTGTHEHVGLPSEQAGWAALDASSRPQSAKPGYKAAFIHNCLLAALAIAAAIVLRIMLVRLNRKLDRGEKVEGVINAAPSEAVEHGFRFRV